MRAWDRVRIEPSSTEEGCGDLFLMDGQQRAPDRVIACLPLRGPVSRAAVETEAVWRFMLDMLAGINERAGARATVLVEASNGDHWEHAIPPPEPEPITTRLWAESEKP